MPTYQASAPPLCIEGVLVSDQHQLVGMLLIKVAIACRHARLTHLQGHRLERRHGVGMLSLQISWAAQMNTIRNQSILLALTSISGCVPLEVDRWRDLAVWAHCLGGDHCRPVAQMIHAIRAHTLRCCLNTVTAADGSGMGGVGSLAEDGGVDRVCQVLGERGQRALASHLRCHCEAHECQPAGAEAIM